MTPQERARRLIQDIITKHYEESARWTAPAPIAAALTETLAVIPRTHLPQVKYTEADQAYEHTMGNCHEDFGSAAAMDIAAEWVAIAEHMAEREAAAQLEKDAMALYTAQRRERNLLLPPDGWPNDIVRAAWLNAARAVRAVDEMAAFHGDADLAGMDQ